MHATCIASRSRPEARMTPRLSVSLLSPARSVPNATVRCLAARFASTTTPESAPSDTARPPHERVALAVMAGAASLFLVAPTSFARLEGVNKPELLPSTPGSSTFVIDVAGFLSDGQEKRIQKRVEALQADTGIKLRVLAQNYPDTPGLAIKDYWGVDGDTIVFVADPNTGNILNFNVGDNVDFQVPRSFWSKLAGKFGTKFYWQDNGEDVAIVNAVAAIDNCLREPIGRLQCSTVVGELE